MDDEFRLLMIGAMYENGGNTTHRFLDGHPELYVYPFESQLGTHLVVDRLSSLFPVKYRWPVFALDATAEADYRAIIDEECKVRARTPRVSKFRDYVFDFDDDVRRARYVELVSASGRSRPANVAAFFRSTFDVWRNLRRSGEERVYVGYSPALTVDADVVLGDFALAHFVHVVRNPWSAYADTKKRPLPLPLSDYMLCWALNQYYATLNAARFPDRFHIVRIEDVMADPGATLGRLLAELDVGPAASLTAPSWNGEELAEVYPWGTIRSATLEANAATATELSAAECAEVAARAGPYLERFAYLDLDPRAAMG
jgi:Sulfotransferase family